MHPIRLTTPKQSSCNNAAIETNPRQLEQWIAALPTNNVIETVQQLDIALSALNEFTLDPENRLKLLEIYFAAFSTTFQCYDEMRIAQLKVSSKQKRQLAKDILWLYIKLSHGYKIIVKGSAGAEKSAKVQQYLIIATFRALELTITSLTYSYRFGLDAPPLVYLEINQLFAFAEYHGILENRIKVASGYSKPPTIASLYKLALVFIGLEPNRFEPIQIDLLFLALQPFSHEGLISQVFPGKSCAFLYTINLAKNQPPGVTGMRYFDDVTEWTRYFDISPMVNAIKDWLEANKTNKNTLLIEHELEMFPEIIDYLKTKQELAKKNHAAAQNPQSVKLIIGLLPIQSLLNIKTNDLNISLDFHLTEWAVNQQTQLGCRLSNQLNILHEDLSLGDLVAIITPKEHEDEISLKRIAIIQRIEQLQYDQLYIDLEYLTGNAIPSTYTVVSDQDKAEITHPLNGIYLCNGAAAPISPLMIIDRRHFDQSKHYLIETPVRTCTIQATKLVKETLRYSIFEFNVIQEDASGAATIVTSAA